MGKLAIVVILSWIVVSCSNTQRQQTWLPKNTHKKNQHSPRHK